MDAAYANDADSWGLSLQFSNTQHKELLFSRALPTGFQCQNVNSEHLWSSKYI